MNFSVDCASEFIGLRNALENPDNFDLYVGEILYRFLHYLQYGVSEREFVRKVYEITYEFYQTEYIEHYIHFWMDVMTKCLSPLQSHPSFLKSPILVTKLEMKDDFINMNIEEQER